MKIYIDIPSLDMFGVGEAKEYDDPQCLIVFSKKHEGDLVQKLRNEMGKKPEHFEPVELYMRGLESFCDHLNEMVTEMINYPKENMSIQTLLFREDEDNVYVLCDAYM